MSATLLFNVIACTLTGHWIIWLKCLWEDPRAEIPFIIDLVGDYDHKLQDPIVNYWKEFHRQA